MADKIKRVRQIDIARAVGVHQTLVSAALNGTFNNSTVRAPEEKVKEIIRVARQMGYKPNRAALELRGEKSYIIGMLMAPPSLTFISERHMRLIVMEQIACEKGYRMMIGHLLKPEHSENYVNDFISRGVEGVLCLQHEMQGVESSIASHLSKIDNVVYLGRPAGVENPRYVSMDHSSGIFQAVNYLFSKGRKKIGLALAGRKYTPMIERMDGYKKGILETGLESGDDLIWIGPEKVVPKAQYMESIYQELVVDKKVDSIIASNDDWAIILIKHLQKKGVRVPDDIAVVGYDNLRISELVSPALTTIDGREEVVGQNMINMLFDLIENGRTQRDQIVVKPELVSRESA
jgi:DNA-binding LacI/PurR family transcriptional regulator